MTELPEEKDAAIGEPVPPKLVYDGQAYASDNGVLLVMNLLSDTSALTCETVYYRVKVYELEAEAHS